MSTRPTRPAAARAPARSGPGRPEQAEGGCSTTTRRAEGRTSDQLFVLCRPMPGQGDAATQAGKAYDALLAALALHGTGPQALVSETVHFADIRRDLEALRGSRLRVLAKAGGAPCHAAPTFIEQPPLAHGVELELSAVAVLPHDARHWSPSELRRSVPCGCPTCSRGVRASTFAAGNGTFLHAAGIHGRGRSTFEQASEMFRIAEELLAEAGMTFRDVLRTWIYLRDIDRDYDDLNRARREFFRYAEVERQPASTGVQGGAFCDVHDVSLSLYAARPSRPLHVTVMSTPALNDAAVYGADFSRGLRVDDGDRDTLYVSGTASIGETGQTLHTGDFAAQVDRMLHNIETLLAGQGARFGDLVSAVTYLKDPADAAVLCEMLQRRGFAGFPHALVAAPLCRPELLCETEAIAILPRSGSQE